MYEALVARNNIATLQSYHTSGRMILHSSPSVTGSDSGVFESLAKVRPPPLRAPTLYSRPPNSGPARWLLQLRLRLFRSVAETQALTQV